MGNEGRPRRVTDREILLVFKDHPDPALANKDVVSELPLTESGVYNRIENLAEQGYLETKKVGKSGKIYWITNEGREFLEGSE